MPKEVFSVCGSNSVLIYQINLNEGKTGKSDVSAVLLDSNYLLCMKTRTKNAVPVQVD